MCDDEDCVDGYRACVLLHKQCQAVFVNSERQWATLKTNTSSVAKAAGPGRHVIYSEDAWKLALRDALKTGEGVLSEEQLKRSRPGFYNGGGRRGRRHGGLLPFGMGMRSSS